MDCTIAGAPSRSWRACEGLVRITIPHRKPDTPSLGFRFVAKNKSHAESLTEQDFASRMTVNGYAQRGVILSPCC
jgi:hypothetical protein